MAVAAAGSVLLPVLLEMQMRKSHPYSAWSPKLNMLELNMQKPNMQKRNMENAIC